MQIFLNAYRRFVWYAVMLSMVWIGSYVTFAAPSVSFIVNVEYQGSLVNEVSDIEVSLVHFVKGNKVSFPQAPLSKYRIVNGLIHFSIPVDDTNIMHFDQPGLYLSLYIQELNESISVPFTSVSKALVTDLSDRTMQLGSGKGVSINYLTQAISFGGSPVSGSVYVPGTVNATKFFGDGRYITGVQGDGLADDSSLERYGSRRLSNRQASQNSDLGVDAVVVNNDGYVGVNTRPLRSFDVLGRVMALTDSDRVGDFKYPLDVNKSFVAWDHVQGAFKFGYVTRKASVLNQNAFSRSSVSIGDDIVNYGDNSVVLGGVGHTVSGNYVVVLGGKYHIVDDLALYSSVVGGDSNILKARNVLDIGGEENSILSEQSLAIASKKNTLTSGRHQVVIGDNNVVSGDHIYVIGGSNFTINSKDVLAMGSAGGTILAPHSWVLNLTDAPLSSVYSKQVIWAAPNGISVNTSNVGVDLSIGGALELTAPDTYFYGDGSLLENVILQDKFWDQQINVNNVVSLLHDYRVLLGNVQGNLNRLSLESGVRFSHDDSAYAGTLIYKDDTLQGYVKDGVTRNLLVQDTDTTYQFSSVFEYTTGLIDTIQLKIEGVEVGKALVFNGNTWEIEYKPSWENYNQHMWYDRPVSLWSDTFGARLTVSDSEALNNNSIKFSRYNFPDIIKLKDSSIQFGDYSLSFSVANDAFSIKKNDVSTAILAIKKGRVNFFSDFSDNFPSFSNSMYIPTQSQFQNLVIDSPTAEGSNLRHANLTIPFLQYYNDALNIQSIKDKYIYFNQNGYPHSMITNKYELMIGTNDALTALSNQVRIPMVYLATGNVVLNTGYKIGVFNTNRVMEKGLKFNNNAIQLVPGSEGDSVFISSTGLRVRGNRDRGVLSIVDDTEDTILHVKSNTISSSMQFKNNLNTGSFSVDGDILSLGKDNQSVIEMVPNKLNIYSPSPTYADINVGGVLNVTGNVPLNVMDINNFIQVTGNSFVLNAKDRIKLESGLNLTGLGVGIGSGTDPSFGFHVRRKAHIQDGVYLMLDSNNRIDRIESKTLKGSDSGALLSNLRVLEFNSAQGFNVSASNSVLDGDAIAVSVAFDPHFSTINIQNNSEPNTPIVPIGADTFTFASPHYDIAFNSDSKLAFKSNLLESGGEIASSVSVNGRVTVQKSDSDNTLFTIFGSIKDMTAIPFPWKSVGGNQVVMDSIKVGIGLDNPAYHLDIAGNMDATQVMVQGVTFNSIETPDSSSYLSVIAENDVDVNLESSNSFPTSLGALSFSKSSDTFSAAINNSDCNSGDTAVKFKVCDSGDSGDSGDAMVRFKNNNLDSSSSVMFGINPILKLASDYLEIGYGKPIYIMDGRVSILSGRLGLLTQSPKNTLDIAGSLLVGDSIQSEFNNSMMVQGRVQVGSSADSLDQALNVKGGVRVGNKPSFLTNSNSNSNDALFIQDSLHVHSQHSGTGGLYVSGNVEAKVVSVESSVSLTSSGTDFFVNRRGGGNLNIQSTSNLTTNTELPGLILSNNVGVGVSNPTAPLHIASSGSLKIESVNNVAQLEFKSPTVNVHQNGSTLNIVMDENGKAPLQVNKTGVDIGYTDTDPTHNVDVVALDVNGNMDASSYSLGGGDFGHVPIGSIVMWSGWTNELPEGWKICDGGSTGNGTDKCDLRGQFIMGSANTFDQYRVTENLTWTSIDGTTTHNAVTHNHSVVRVTHDHNPKDNSNKSYVLSSSTPVVSTQLLGYENHPYIFYDSTIQEFSSNYQAVLDNASSLANTVGVANISSSKHYRYLTNTEHDHDPDPNQPELHSHQVSEQAGTEPTHNHNLVNKGHSHAENALHEHGDKKENPKFYTLMFIYLEGVGN